MKFLDKLISYMYGLARSKYYSRRYQHFKKFYRVHPSFHFNGTDIRLYGDGIIELGPNSYIGTNSTLQSEANCRIVIGEMCQISHNVRVYTSSLDPDQDFRQPKIKPSKIGDVIIGDGVWIGANVFINPNITIGDNSVIGANSVVTKDVAANTIVGGVPAKIIRKKTEVKDSSHTSFTDIAYEE